MNPLRWDVLGVALVLALPVLALALRGDFTLADVTSRLPWCFAAAWLGVSLLRWAARPKGAPQPAPRRARPRPAVPPDGEHPEAA
jgi:hypothetical protein